MRTEQLAVPVRVRCTCGHLYADEHRYCPQCGKPRGYVERELKQLAAASGESIEQLEERDRAGVLTATLPDAVRTQRLQRAVAALTSRGYEVVYQTDTNAQLKQPKQFSWLVAIFFLVLTAGIGLIIYLLYIMVAKPKLLHLTVDGRGTVHPAGAVDGDMRTLMKDLNESV